MCGSVSDLPKGGHQTSGATPRVSIRCDQYRPSAAHPPWDIAVPDSRAGPAVIKGSLNQSRAHWIQMSVFDLLLNMGRSPEINSVAIGRSETSAHRAAKPRDCHIRKLIS